MKAPILSCAIIVTLALGALNAVYAGSATWNPNPTSGDWHTAVNWTPATVPNGPADTATFATSAVTDLSTSAGVEVDGITFNPGADAFTITNVPGLVLTISGTGVINNSSVLQNFINQENRTNSGTVYFTNSATAGDSVVYTNQTPTNGGQSPLIQFEDSSTAGSAQFINQAASFSSHAGLIEFQGNSTAANGTFRNTGFGDLQFPTINFRDQASAGQAVFTNEVDAEGMIQFYDTSTADHATFTNEPAFDSSVFFHNDSTAGNATIINEGANSANSPNEFGLTFFLDNSAAGNGAFIADGAPGSDGGAQVIFTDKSNAGTGTFTANGGEVSGAVGGAIAITTHSTGDHGIFSANGGKVPGANGGTISVENFATAEAGTFYANGTTVDGAFGGRVQFFIQTPTAGAATLIATTGVGDGEGAGGGILFEDDSAGAQARIELFGNGFLDLRDHDTPELTIGSLEGNGLVFLGGANLSIGSNNLSTIFSGLIEEASEGVTGALTKVGTGILMLTGANTYTGGTTIEGGKLVVNNRSGSATGTGAVQVNAGVLAGRGTIAGAVIVGTGSGGGAALAPGRRGSKPDILTIQGALTFQLDSTYKFELKSSTATADKVVANGVTINDGAQFSPSDLDSAVLPIGTVFTAISNTAATPITGTFANLADESTITIGNNTFQADYEGSDGNDLTLTVIP